MEIGQKYMHHLQTQIPLFVVALNPGSGSTVSMPSGSWAMAGLEGHKELIIGHWILYSNQLKIFRWKLFIHMDVSVFVIYRVGLKQSQTKYY